MIDAALAAEILRLYHVEKWKRGTIARQLGVHHDVVDRVLSNDGVPRPRTSRPSKLDDYLPFILDTLRRWPRLTASRLFDMCRERGYRGSADHFRHMVARYRPRPEAEAYLRLRTLPGEQGQVDWGHFGTVKMGRAERKLLAFVIVLSWSRAIFVRFFMGACTENFLRGHPTGCSPSSTAFDYAHLVKGSRRHRAIPAAGSPHNGLLDIIAADRHRPQRTLGGVVVDRQPPVVEVATQRRLELQRVAQGLAHGALRQHRCLRGRHPCEELVRDRHRVLLAQIAPRVVVELARFGDAFDGIELTDALDRLLREPGLAPLRVDEFAPRVRPARDLGRALG
jgi:hypothetical protein